MRTLLNILLSFCFLQNSFCQISGKLVTPNNQPIPFANVLLLRSNDSALVKAVLTNEKGDYEMENLVRGKYLLRYSSVGYQSWDSPAFDLAVDGQEKNFGTIVMKENDKQLEQVIVRAQKPLFQQQPEGTIINVESSILTKGSSALQVLERSPGVMLDYRNNSIALNGKTGVLVMINGKLLRMTMEQVVSLLNGMSADDIEKIELLTTPPAKYDADGNAGLINIVLKKNKKMGTNAAVSLSAGYGWREKATGSINLSHNTGNINLYGSYAFSHNRTYTDLDITSAQNMPFLGGDVFVRYWDTAKWVNNSHDAAIGIDIKLNAKTTIGASMNYNNSISSGSRVTHAGYNVLPDSLIIYDGVNSGENRWQNLMSSVYLEKQINEKEKIIFDFDYLYYKNDGNSAVHSSFINKNGAQAGGENLFAPGQKGFANTGIKVSVAKIDYTKQLGRKIKLEAGMKATYTTSSSISGIESLVNGEWTSNDETSNRIYMKEGIGAMYASANTKIDESTNLVIGARYEYAHTNMDNPKTGVNIIDRKLGTLFPNIYFSKKITDKSELQLSYTKRISRPAYNDLASYVGYADPTAVYTGNPFLKPTITHNFKVGYNYKSYSFSVLFSRDNNAIVRYQLTQSPAADILFISPQNLNWQNNISLQANLPFSINNWWNMNFNLVGRFTQFKLDYTLHPLEKSYLAYSLNFSQNFKLPKNFSAELSGWYNSDSYDGTKKVDGFGTLNFGIKKELENNGGSFQLSVSDILKTQIYRIHYGAITQEAFSIKSYVIVNSESTKSPIIKLTYTRSFGSNGLNVQKKQVNVSGEERERVRKD